MKVDDQEALARQSELGAESTTAEPDSELQRVLKEAARSPEYSISGPIPSGEQTGSLPAAAAAAAGSPRIDSYELLEELGRGGMGAVYKARQKQTGRLVAVKVILGRRGAHPEVLRRFEREIRILGKLRHPRIADIYTAGMTLDGDPYFAMELVEGVTLDRYQATQPALRERLEVFRKVCDAVAHSHRVGAIHRDLKPQNVMVCGGGTEVKVLDFGLARLDESDGETLTRQGLVQGTLPYMSPEQINGEPLTTLSDVYALGVMLYELLTGRRPYAVPSQNLREAARVICETRPVPPSSVKAGHPRKRDLDAVVLKALEKVPSRRYQSVAELSGDIENYLTHQPVLSSQFRIRLYQSVYKLGLFCRRNRAAVVVGCLATIVLAGLGLWSFRSVEAQRQVAEQNALAASRYAQESQRRLAELYAEQGRQALLTEEPVRAAVYLGEAYRLGPASPSLRLLLGLGARALSVEPPRVFEEKPGVLHPSMVTPDGRRLVTIDAGGAAQIRDTASGKLLRTLGDAASKLSAAAFSPDGKQVVTASETGAVTIWDAASGSLQRALADAGTDPGRPIRSIVFSPDGCCVAGAGGASTMVWEVHSGRLVVSARDSFVPTAPVFSPDGGRILVHSIGGLLSLDRVSSGPASLQVLDSGTGRLLTSPEVGGAAMFATFSPDGSKILTGGSGDSDLAVVLDAVSGKVLMSIRDPEGRTGRNSLAVFSPDGSKILTLTPLRVWDAAKGKLIATLEGDDAGVVFPSFSADGLRVVGGRLQGDLRIWDSQTGKRLASLQTPSALLAMFSPDGTHLVTADKGRTAVWPIPAAPWSAAVKITPGRLDDMEFSADGRRFTTESFDGQARLWDSDGGKLVSSLPVPVEAWDAAFDSAGRWLVTTFEETAVRVTDGQSRETVATLEAARESPASARFSPDGRVLAMLGEAGSVEAWDLKSGKHAVWSPDRPAEPPFLVVASPDGGLLLAEGGEVESARQLATRAAPVLKSVGGHLGLILPRSRSLPLLMGQSQGGWELLDARSGRSIARFEGREANAAAFSSDGSRALIARGSSIEILDTATGRREAAFEAPWSSTASFAFSPAGDWIALGGLDGEVRLVESLTGQLVTSLRTSGSGVVFLAFSPDGSRLAASGEDGVVSVLELPLETRSAEDYWKLVRCRAPWRISGGRLVTAELDPCPP